jgi:hypothetical protein
MLFLEDLKDGTRAYAPEFGVWVTRVSGLTNSGGYDVIGVFDDGDHWTLDTDGEKLEVRLTEKLTFADLEPGDKFRTTQGDLLIGDEWSEELMKLAYTGYDDYDGSAIDDKFEVWGVNYTSVVEKL